MCFFEELHCKLCLRLHETKFDSWDVKENINLMCSVIYLTAVR